MSMQTTPIVFLSYSHHDKRVARRLFRELSAHGVKVLLDERELQIGEPLTASIQTKIQSADTLIVIASQASTRSDWVGKELEFARAHGRKVIPLFIEPVSEHERFRDCLGLDCTQPQAFATVVHDLLSSLYSACDAVVPAADPTLLLAGLRELEKEEPELVPLISGCLDAEGLHHDNANTVFDVSFHALDYALNTLFELNPDNKTACHAASGFREAGAGLMALSTWIERTGDGELPLVTAVGSSLDPSLFPTAIKLLSSCSPPNNHALYKFIDSNSAALDDVQRRMAIRLTTWPVSADSGRLADVLGWVALKKFSDAQEIRQMWTRWIRDGSFDGTSNSPRDLARYLADGDKEGLPGWDTVNEALRSHVRACLRSGDKNRICVAIDHIMATADADAHVRGALLREAEGVSRRAY